MNEDQIDQLPFPKGEVSILRVLDKNGASVDPSTVIEGEFTPDGQDGVILGRNMVVNLGRATIAKLLGGQEGTPANWFITKVSFGTGDFTPKYSDSTLSPQPVGITPGGGNETDLGSGVYKKAVDSVDFPGTFLVRFLFSLDYGEGNGEIIRETGLWTENETLFARKTLPGIAKSADVRIDMAWTIRC